MTAKPSSSRVIPASPNVADPPQFEKMTWDAFEALCCSLLTFEPDVISADLHRVQGQAQFGVDVVGRTTREGGKAIAISCKCYSNVTPKQIESWFEEFVQHWGGKWKAAGIDRFIIAVTAGVTAQKFEKTVSHIESRCFVLGVKFELWSPRIIQEKIRLHPGLVGHFLGREWIPRICGAPEDSVADPNALLNQRFAYAQAGDFEQAIRCSDEAVQLARDLKLDDILRRSLTALVRDLGDLLVSYRSNDSRVSAIRHRISAHLKDLEDTNISEVSLNLERAAFARLDDRPEDALRFAEAAETNASEPSDVADSLLIQIHAHWGLRDYENALALRDKIAIVCRQSLSPDAFLVLQSAWLRTLSKCGAVERSCIDEFSALVREIAIASSLPLTRLLFIVDDVVSEPSFRADLKNVTALLNLALELAAKLQDPNFSSRILIQRAEVEAELGQERSARSSSSLAAIEIGKLATQSDLSRWANTNATFLVTLGRIESRLAHHAKETLDSVGQEERLTEMYRRFVAAREFVTSNRANLSGDVDIFIADIDLRIGIAAASLGLHTEAVQSLRLAQTIDLATNPQYVSLVAEAMSREADSKLLVGSPGSAREILNRIMLLPDVNTELRHGVEQNIRFLDKSVAPVIDWFDSDAAQQIRYSVVSQDDGLRITIAEQLRPLVEWIQEFPRSPNEQGVFSGLIDVWGRGGFSRVVAAVRADPLSSISVDASSVQQIRLWARVFCPIYDVVIVNWKGATNSCLSMVPMPTSLGADGRFGGQGYTGTSTLLRDKPGWMFACGWSNLLPEEVGNFVAEEALSLVRKGRLVVLPAPLIGCTQNAVGWTDNLFVDTLLGGVVKSAGIRSGDARTREPVGESRVLDLGAVSIPFMNNVSMNELASILDDTGDLQRPLKRLFRETIGSSHLRHERWDRLGTVLQDIRKAFRELDETFRKISSDTIAAQERGVSSFPGAFSALRRPKNLVGADPVTDMLQSTAAVRNDLGPWIPFWRLKNEGGQIDWSGPLSNRSSPPDEMARSQGFASPITQGWIYPGDGGPGFRAVRRVALDGSQF